MTWWEWLLVTLAVIVAGLIYLSNWFANDMENPK